MLNSTSGLTSKDTMLYLNSKNYNLDGNNG